MPIGASETQILAAALRGLEAQRKAAEHNIANVETPGFQARRVSFEQALSAAVESGEFGRGADARSAPSSFVTTSLSTDVGRIDGSNVDLDDEIRSLEINALKQQLVTEALNTRYTRLRTAIGRT